MKNYIVVNSVECPTCGDIIYSRARHDFRSCSCGNTFIDGGFDYTRIGGKNITKLKVKDKILNITKKKLYDDWNEGKDKFGLIKGV